MTTVEIPPDLIGQSGLYNSPDPLLRRLRLDDTNGQPITDIDKYFEGKELLILYAGSEYGIANLKELHKNLTSIALRNLKPLSILYVSTDIDPSKQDRVVKDVPWLRMTFHDNSDFAPMGKGEKVVEVEDVERGEEFIQAGEIDLGIEKVTFGEDENRHDYVRPLSRAALTTIMKAYSTPSIAVYHIPSHTFVSKNLRLSALSSANIEKNLHTWRNGGQPSLRILDVLYHMRWALIVLFLAITYRLVTYYRGGENHDYHFIPDLLDKISWRSGPLAKQA